jgi:hypothetical protein
MHATTTAEITDHRPPISSFLEIAGKVGIVQRSSDIRKLAASKSNP